MRTHAHAQPTNKQTNAGPDEVVLAKTTSSPFASTVLEHLLRSLGRDQLVVCGALTDQCVSSTVREAADRGFRVTLARDACVGSDGARHEGAVAHVAGYCRVRTSAQCAAELLGGGGGC
jgi:ureidoacrylate peracid hydrolase